MDQYTRRIIGFGVSMRERSMVRYFVGCSTRSFKASPAFQIFVMWTILAPSKIFSPQQEFLIDRSGDVGHHARPKHFGFPLDLHPIESEIVDAVFQSEKTIRGEPVESCKLRYFNSFEFIDHGKADSPIDCWSRLLTAWRFPV
jgi:hypothetical protein